MRTSMLCILVSQVFSSSLKCQEGTHLSIRRRRLSYCRSCPSGYFNNEKNHRNYHCNACPSGKHSKSRQTSCEGSICPSGQYGKVGAMNAQETECKLCSPGQYQLYSGQEDCKSCLSGQYQPKSGQPSCIGNSTCPRGKYGTRNSVSVLNTYHCYDCPTGKYTNITGSVECNECGKDEYQLIPGSTACSQVGCDNYNYFNISWKLLISILLTRPFYVGRLWLKFDYIF